MSELFSIPIVHTHVESIGARIDSPIGAHSESAILLAHGAGIDMEHPWMATMCAALVARGFTVMRFRYPYMERAQRESKTMPPDRAPALEDAHATVFEEFTRRIGSRRRLLAGKSLGARMSTHLAAKGIDAHGLILLGYPLHPPRKPDQRRSEHFAAIVQPALFLQGTRDEFGTPEDMQLALQTYAGRATLSIVEGADHSFELPARFQLTLPAVLADLATRIEAWERETWPN